MNCDVSKTPVDNQTRKLLNYNSYALFTSMINSLMTQIYNNLGDDRNSHEHMDHVFCVYYCYTIDTYDVLRAQFEGLYVCLNICIQGFKFRRFRCSTCFPHICP